MDRISYLIRPSVILTAEIIFHGKEKDMLLRPEIAKREGSQTYLHALFLT